jgi:glycosyltransferase involved in cell wall biosynthesis
MDNLPHPFELLIVDNNPSAGISSLVEKVSAETDFPIYYVPEPRRGPSYARNTGIRMAKGAYVAFLDDDCTVHQDWLMNLMSAFLERRCDIVQGRILLEFGVQNIPDWLDDSDMANLALFDPGDHRRHNRDPQCMHKEIGVR